MFDIIVFGLFGLRVTPKVINQIAFLLEKEFEVEVAAYGLRIKPKESSNDTSS